jgi:hypothetical protein
LRERRADPAELGGSKGHGHSAQEAAATMVDFFRHFDRVHFLTPFGSI